MQKWEYCLLLYHPGLGIFIIQPDGEQMRYRLNKHTWAGTMKWLGDKGWEAVNYVSGIGDWGKVPMKSLTSDKIGWPIISEILFKRPKEE